MKPPLRLSPLGKEQLDELQELYRTTRKVRLRTRAQMVLLAAGEGMTAPAIAPDRKGERPDRKELAQAIPGRGNQRACGCPHTRRAP